ncbi:MAG: VCBS repeat-containing protein [Proteobacteria bacterium]|jgi:hypothetical protein|nr:VCBS repeat-containing protein [Pseudomonadota bacterium]
MRVVIVVASVFALMSSACTCDESRSEGHDPDSSPDSGADAGGDACTDVDADSDVDAGVDASADCVLATLFFEEFVIADASIHVFMAAGDFNEDGIVDLVVTQSSTIGVFLGNGEDGIGDGTMSYDASYLTGENPYGIAVADFDEDGVLDLAVNNFLDNDISILLGDGVDGIGDGTFASPVDYPTGEGPYAIEVADLDEDDVFDLVTANISDNTISILFGNGSDGVGDGTFATQVTYGDLVYLPGYVEVADLNEDGIPDLVVAGNSSANVRVLYGNGFDGHADGTFAVGGAFTVGDHPHATIAADFDEDGHLDLAVSNYESNDISILLGTGETGDGAFLEQVVYPVGNVPSNLALSDLDNDGVLDLAVSNKLSDTVGILAGCGEGGIGDGTFGAQVEYSVQEGPGSIIAADFDEDGLMDLATANHVSDSIFILYGEWAE